MIIKLWSITLAIDHKPLIGLFGDFKPISHLAYLVEYKNGLAYRFDLDDHSWSGEKLGTADALTGYPYLWPLIQLQNFLTGQCLSTSWTNDQLLVKMFVIVQEETLFCLKLASIRMLDDPQPLSIKISYLTIGICVNCLWNVVVLYGDQG